MRQLFKNFWSDESGISAIQYALIAIICSVSIIVMLNDLRAGVNTHLNEASTGMQDATH